MHVGEGDFVRRLIRFVNRGFERIRRRGDAQNAPARGDNLPIDQLCTRVEEGYELTYTFDKDYFMYHLRCLVPVYRSVMSITGQYWYAFVWENEIHDLFGLKIDFIERDVDYGGHFYHLAEKTPWHDLPGEKHADQAIKVQLRSGLGIDASAVAGVKPEGGKENG